MSDTQDTTLREMVPAGDVRAGDWISPCDEEPAEPMQVYWRTGERAANGDFRWSFKTSAGFRHFDQDAWVYRAPRARLPASAGVDHPEPLTVAPADAIDQQVRAERAMLHAIIRDTVVALPVTIAVLVGMMAWALRNKQPWYAWVGLGTALGIYAAGFFGTIAGVMLSSHVLDDLDDAAMHEPAGQLRSELLA